MKKDNAYRKICPKCGSTNIGAFTKAGSLFGEKIIDFCKDCHYGYIIGGFFPEMKASEIKKFREKLEKTKT